MLAGTVTRDNNSKVVSLDKRRQEIQRRIGNLQERITGARKSNIVVKHPSDENKYSQFDGHQFTLSDNRKSKGVQVRRSYIPPPPVLDKKSSGQDISQLYDLLKTTLQGQTKLQQQLRLLRQDMNNMSLKDRQASSPHLKERKNIDIMNKENGSPADRLYSNEYINGAKCLENSLQMKNGPSDISTTPFWQNQAAQPFQTAHFNNNTTNNNPSITYQPPSTKRNQRNAVRTSRDKILNFSQEDPRIFEPRKQTIDSPLKIKPRRKFSGRKSNQSRENPSNKSTIKSPKGILKNSIPPMTHYEELRKIYGVAEMQNVHQSGILEDNNSKSMRRSSKKHRIIEISQTVKSFISAKIQERLFESKESFVDSTHKNAKHQHDHLTNTVQLEKKLRIDLLRKIYEMRDTKRYK